MQSGQTKWHLKVSFVIMNFKSVKLCSNALLHFEKTSKNLLPSLTSGFLPCFATFLTVGFTVSVRSLMWEI